MTRYNWLTYDGKPVIGFDYPEENAMENMGAPVRQTDSALRESEELIKALQELNAGFDALEGRLQPVMSPTTTPQGEDEKKLESPASPVLSNIRESRSRVRHIMRRLHGLIEKIEL